MEAVHIIMPKGYDLIEENSYESGFGLSLWKTKPGAFEVLSGTTSPTMKEAIDKHNAMFSKARGAYDYE